MPRKYPRTYHLPWSPGATSDDRVLHDLLHLRTTLLVVTEKMDGGNFTMMRDRHFARSLTSGTHAWDSLTVAEWARVRSDIPKGWRISGESMHARRSVPYDALPGPYLVFGIWTDRDELLSWDDTVEWAEMLELPVVPRLYLGDLFDDAVRAWEVQRTPDISEGFVIRARRSIPLRHFSTCVAKYVRANHVQTRADWRHRDDFALNGITR